ncbi:MAG: SdrD B-like domain-containing protein, partial [Aureliella sp.]
STPADSTADLATWGPATAVLSLTDATTTDRLVAQTSAGVTIVTTIQASFAGTTIPNSATAQADDAALVTANASTDVNPDIDLQITKSDNVDPVNRGGVLVYTLTVFNDGPSGATNVEVVDTLPADVTFVSAVGGTVTDGTVGSSGPVTIDLGSMASKETKTITLTVNVANNAAATFNNTAIVRSTESTAGFDRDTTNNTDTESTATQAVIDLELLKTASAATVKPGQPLVYTIVVTNKGPSDATLVSMTDNIPDGIQITSATSTVGTVTIPASAQDTTAANTDDLTLNIGNLAKDATVTITVNATVLPGTTGTITNTANVSTTDTDLTETITANNTGSVTTTLTPEIDLAITKTDSVDPATAGSPLTYSITVTNSGPSTATNVNVTDNLPTGVSFTSGSASQGTVTNAAGVVTGSLGTLAPGATATMTIIVGVNAATRGTITNTASVVGAQTEPNTNNNSAAQDTLINGSVDLVITKVDSIDPVAVGGVLSYTIEVTNNGPSTATNVVVTDNLPTTLAYVSGNATIGTVTNAGNAVTANVGTLASGAKAVITVNTTVSGAATGTISNTATVVATEADSNTANNSATQTTALVMPGSISGFAYLDLNRDGTRDAGDAPLPNVAIALSGTETGTGIVVTRQTTTDATGAYTFGNVLPGTYQLVQTQPPNLKEGQANVGTGATGVAGTNQITAIQIASGANAQAFNFGELRPDLSKRRFLASTDLTLP